jgi:hypothetical protein
MSFHIPKQREQTNLRPAIDGGFADHAIDFDRTFAANIRTAQPASTGRHRMCDDAKSSH